MSELALSYYQERVERLDLDAMPTILNGRPVLLFGEDHDQRLSLQRPDPDRLQTVSERYGEILKSIDGFVLDAFTRTREASLPAAFAAEDQKRANDAHIAGMIENKLFPVRRKVGHLKDVQIEALARSEVQPGLLRLVGATRGESYRPEKEDTEVYLQVTGALHAGRPLGYAACLSMVAVRSRGQRSYTKILPAYTGSAYRKNDRVGRSSIG